jgi:hypothetical protein
MRAAPGLRALGLILALFVEPDRADAATPDEAVRHLRAAKRQAAGLPELEKRRRAWCSAGARPPSALSAVAAVRGVEAAYRAAAYSPVRATQRELLGLVVQRECAAYHAARLEPQVRRPVWLFSDLRIVAFRLSGGLTGAVEAEAEARNIDGPVRNSRITFSQGLHMSCFVATGIQGAARCTLVDTHPHGPGWNPFGDPSHQGPLIATLAGSVSSERVELPAVVERPWPASFAPRWQPTGLELARSAGGSG